MGHQTRLPFNFLYLPTSWEISVCFLQPFFQLQHLTIMQLFRIPRLYLTSPIYSMGKFKQYFQSFKAMSSPGESKHCPYMYEAKTHALNYFSLSCHTVAVDGSTTGCWGKKGHHKVTAGHHKVTAEFLLQIYPPLSSLSCEITRAVGGNCLPTELILIPKGILQRKSGPIHFYPESPAMFSVLWA